METCCGSFFLGPAIFLPFLHGEPPSLHPSSMGDGGIGASSEDSSSSEQCMIRLQQVWQAMRADKMTKRRWCGKQT